eukprot:5384223-Amphidinium_carterae.2
MMGLKLMIFSARQVKGSKTSERALAKAPGQGRLIQIDDDGVAPDFYHGIQLPTHTWLVELPPKVHEENRTVLSSLPFDTQRTIAAEFHLSSLCATT